MFESFLGEINRMFLHILEFYALDFFPAIPACFVFLSISQLISRKPDTASKNKSGAKWTGRADLRSPFSPIQPPFPRPPVGLWASSSAAAPFGSLGTFGQTTGSAPVQTHGRFPTLRHNPHPREVWVPNSSPFAP